MTDYDKKQDWYIKQFITILEDHTNKLNQLVKIINKDSKFNKQRTVK